MRIVRLVLAALVLTAGCGGDGARRGGGGGGGAFDRMVAGAQSCGVITPGRVSYSDLEPGDDCWAGCIADRATCSDYESIFCDTGTSAVENDCGVLCSPEVTCGDGSTVPNGYRCDGSNDCADGADERDCAGFLFTCADGSTVPSSAHCDVGMDCSDGSDEVGCSYYSCADGTQLSLDYVCDLYEDCSGGEDEIGCPTVVCPGA